MVSKTDGRVQISEQVYRVCIAHALMTEREEIMGLLLGDVDVDVRIWASMTLQRSDKRPDRVEISPEQLVMATETAEKVTEEVGLTTRVVGWYHSHPHITCLPSHVDLRTQAQYQAMDESFVGLIFAVFNADPKIGAMRHELMAFRADGRCPPTRLELQVDVVSLCRLLTSEQEQRAMTSSAFGGCLGQDAMVSIAKQNYAEIRERHEDEVSEDGAGVLARVDAVARHISQLNAFMADELMPLRQYFEDEVHNAKTLTAVYQSRNEWGNSQSLERLTPETDVDEVFDPSYAGSSPEVHAPPTPQNHVTGSRGEWSQDSDVRCSGSPDSTNPLSFSGSRADSAEVDARFHRAPTVHDIEDSQPLVPEAPPSPRSKELQSQSSVAREQLIEAKTSMPQVQAEAARPALQLPQAKKKAPPKAKARRGNSSRKLDEAIRPQHFPKLGEFCQCEAGKPEESWWAQPFEDSARETEHPDSVGGRAPKRSFPVSVYGDSAELLAQEYILGCSHDKMVANERSSRQRNS